MLAQLTTPNVERLSGIIMDLVHTIAEDWPLDAHVRARRVLEVCGQSGEQRLARAWAAWSNRPGSYRRAAAPKNPVPKCAP